MTARNNNKPHFQMWDEQAFRADTLYLTPVQRWMYRSLLTAAFVEATRPYLPDDDSKLWKLAGCESAEQWESNKAAIREYFTPVEIKGVRLLENSRVLRDWAYIKTRQDELHEAKVRAGKAGGLASGRSRAVLPPVEPVENTEDGSRTKQNEAESASGPQAACEAQRSRGKQTKQRENDIPASNSEKPLSQEPFIASGSKPSDNARLALLAVEVAIEENAEAGMAFTSEHIKELESVISDLSANEKEVKRAVEDAMAEADTFEAKQAGKRLPVALRSIIPQNRQECLEYSINRGQSCICGHHETAAVQS